MINPRIFLTNSKFEWEILDSLYLNNFCVPKQTKCHLKLHDILNDPNYTVNLITPNNIQKIEKVVWKDYYNNSNVKFNNIIEFYSDKLYNLNSVVATLSVPINHLYQCTMKLDNTAIRIETKKFILDIDEPTLIFF